MPYIGKEKDEETGLGYHSARYYAGWLGRWCAADPGGMVDGVNRFAYSGGDPVGRLDGNGYGAMPHLENPLPNYNLGQEAGASVAAVGAGIVLLSAAPITVGEEPIVIPVGVVVALVGAAIFFGSGGEIPLPSLPGLIDAFQPLKPIPLVEAQLKPQGPPVNTDATDEKSKPKPPSPNRDTEKDPAVPPGSPTEPKSPKEPQNKEGVRVFAHGTSLPHARKMKESGVSMNESLDNLIGTTRPGSLFTHEIGPSANPGAGLQAAGTWAADRYPNEDIGILIIVLPGSEVEALEYAGLAVTKSVDGARWMPDETYFEPGSFPVLNLHKETWQILEFPKESR